MPEEDRELYWEAVSRLNEFIASGYQSKQETLDELE